jgi:SAM-dependent methyltransferase
VRGYRADLAYIHDAGYSGFSEGAAPWLLARLRGSGVRSGLVVDLGCGSGRWARLLLAAGYDVLGVDQSAAAIALARRNAPGATFRRGSFLDAPLPRCDAVTALGEVLGYLMDERLDGGSLGRVFRRVHDALRPGGLFVFDLAAPGRAPGGEPARHHRQGEGWAILSESTEDARARVLTRRITTFVAARGGYRRGEEVHRLRLHRPPDVVAALRRAGFRVRTARAYGALTFPVGLVAYVARRPPEEDRARATRARRARAAGAPPRRRLRPRP